VRLLYTYLLFLMLIAALASGFSTSLFSEENPKAMIANLPKIDYSKQCNKKGECDSRVESEVFSTLATLSDRYLKRGMSKGEVETIFGRPPNRNVDSWKDVRFGNAVTTWLYAISLSGTTGFYIIFVSDRLDYFGPVQNSYMLWQYGKPGSSYGDDPVMQYRFRGKEPG
jgi:hypothetical protein